MSDPRDWAADPATGDLVFEDGDISFSSGLDAIRQDLEERLRLIAGEWFLSDPDSSDPADGIDYFGKVLARGARRATIAAIYRRAILATPGVTAVSALDVRIDRPTRIGTVTFTASTDEGAISTSVAVTAGR